MLQLRFGAVKHINILKRKKENGVCLLVGVKSKGTTKPKHRRLSYSPEVKTSSQSSVSSTSNLGSFKTEDEMVGWHH